MFVYGTKTKEQVFRMDKTELAELLTAIRFNPELFKGEVITAAQIMGEYI